MTLVLIVALFLLGTGLSWVLLFPDGRDFAAHTASRSGRLLKRVAGGLGRGAGSVLGGARSTVGTAAASGWGGLRRHRWLLLAGLALVALPPLLMLAWERPAHFEGYGSHEQPRNEQILLLLRGEQLVPPSPPPPEVFTTREVERIRPALATADRRWDLLDPDFRQRLLVVYRIMREEHGYEMVLLEGYRSPERQNRLAAMGNHVTNAAAFQSWHQFGLAADSAFMRDGRLVISEKDPWAMRGYTLYGQVAESVGLTWGGNWRMRDYGHVELRRLGVRPRPGNL